MRQIRMYQCDKCGAVFKDMAKAAECEAKHLSPEYTEYEYNTGYVMSEIIRAGFCNEKTGVYKLIRIEESEIDRDVFENS